MAFISIESRKEHIVYSADAVLKSAMESRVDGFNRLFDPKRSEHDCWLFPSPPEVNGRPRGTIRITLSWKTESDSCSIGVNYGIVALLVEDSLTVKQKEGFIHKAWQLSHLCGNWTCCNPRHFTVESASINIGRNRCFRSRGPCHHSPACMRSQKRHILITENFSDLLHTALLRADINSTTLRTEESEFLRDLQEDRSIPLMRLCDNCSCVHAMAPFCRFLKSKEKSRMMLAILRTPGLGGTGDVRAMLRKNIKALEKNLYRRG